MPIRFACGQCGETLTVSSKHAGKKGKCACGAINQVPQAAAGPKKSARQLPEGASVASSPSQKITFACESCGKQIRVRAIYAGKKGKCACGTINQVPDAATAGGDPGSMIAFACGGCGEQMNVPADRAGSKGRCRQCGHVIVVPGGVASGTIETAAKVRAGIVMVNCAYCSHVIEAQESSRGNLIECPECSTITEVPEPGGSVGDAARTDGLLLKKVAKSTGLVKCPSCEEQLADDAKVCVTCGIHVHNGRPILMSRGVDDGDLSERAEKIIRPLSWLIPFGIYPTYSDAIGRHRPYATWAIAAITIIVSAMFLGYEWSGSPKMQSLKNLMLWSGDAEPDSERIAMFYAWTSYGDSAAFDAKRSELRGTVPDEQLDRIAMEQLPPEAQCFGQYHHWQLITHAFLHGGPMHLAGNLLFLLVLGSRVNSVIGNILTPVFYLLMAVAAAVMHMTMTGAGPVTSMLGASGAVMGMAGAYLLLFPIHRVYMAIWLRLGLIFGFRLSFKIFALRGLWVVLFYIMFDVVAVCMAAETGTAHWAHIGGIIWGFIGAAILLVCRLILPGSNLISLVLGRHAWPLLGRPCKRQAA